MNTINHITILDIKIYKASLDKLILEAHHAMTKHSPQITFACANPHSLVAAQNDIDFVHSLNSSDQVVVDGVGLALLCKYAGIQLGDRITGHDYFNSVLDHLKLRGHGKVFFFGSSDHVLNAIRERFAKDYPMLDCETYSPPFGDWSAEKNAEMLQMINDEKPDVLWVGMTAPKQEKWVEANRHRLNAPVIGSIGAVFDFYAGTYPRAPQLMCQLGIEWLYRLLKEPRRMWKRNFISTPLFVAKFFMRHVLSKEDNYAVYSCVSNDNYIAIKDEQASIRKQASELNPT